MFFYICYSSNKEIFFSVEFEGRNSFVFHVSEMFLSLLLMTGFSDPSSLRCKEILFQNLEVIFSCVQVLPVQIFKYI